MRWVGIDMAINKKTREEAYNKFNGHCAYCGEEITYRQMQVDHIIPQRNYSEKYKCLISEGSLVREYGVDDIQNLFPACRMCNSWKNTFSVEDFRIEVEAQVQRARKYSRNYRMAEKYGMVAVKKEQITFYFELCP